ncbi:MAG: gephyrin-like molybdotransferase Glp [Pseudomonadota bacterium]
MIARPASKPSDVTYDRAIEILKYKFEPLGGVEDLAVTDALSRVLAENVLSRVQVPAFDNAAVDGYAVRTSDLAQSGEQKSSNVLPVTHTVAADAAPPTALSNLSAARIMTGAAVPQGADAIVMQEHCVLNENGQVEVPNRVQPGINIRRAGEDTAIGDIIVRAGKRVSATDIARVASGGISQVRVLRKLRVGIISSGNEVQTATTAHPTASGAVYDANGPMLQSLCAHLPVNVEFLGILPDDKTVVTDILAEAVQKFDVIISTGGASGGDADHFKNTITALGRVFVSNLAVKPGRPVTIGRIGEAAIFALPGNPVAAFVSWCLFAHPCISRLAGAGWPEPQRIHLPSGFDLRNRKTGRRDFYRGWLETVDGVTRAMKYPRDGSGLISGLQAATGLIELNESTSAVGRGDMVTYWPLSQFGAS